MSSLLSLLKEITFKNQNLIKLKNLEYDPNINREYPVHWKLKLRTINDKQNFNWWKEDMISYYGEDLYLEKHVNKDKKFFYHGKYKLIVPKINTSENKRFWSN